MDKPKLKLFLSMDISGSTPYKNFVNFSKFQERLFQREKIFTHLHSKIKDEINKSNFGDSINLEKIFEDSLVSKISPIEIDWSYRISEIFQDFHYQFLSFLDSETQDKVTLWKTAGDELIYVSDIESSNDLHNILTAFSLTIRTVDKKLKEIPESPHLRLKGTAWSAEFPVRNRIIYFPFPKCENNEKFIYPREDYLGPDMDTGFRLGKETCPGFICVSIELVTLLGKAKTDHQIDICHVGWKNLIGVWETVPYPIFWAKANQKNVNSFEYEEYTEAESAENNYLKHTHNFKEAKCHIDFIRTVLSQLPDRLGVIEPFIPKEETEYPAQYNDLLELTKKINSIRNYVDIEIENINKNEEEFNNDKQETSKLIKEAKSTYDPKHWEYK